MSSETHAFNVAAAMEVGIKAAMLLGKIAFWCDHNAKKDEHFHDGRYWSYASASYFQKEYPYLKLTTIKRVLKKLEEDGYIVTGCYNKLSYDRTTWYSPTDKGLELLSRRVDSLQRETRSKMDQLKSDPVQNGPDPVQNGPGGGPKRTDDTAGPKWTDDTSLVPLVDTSLYNNIGNGQMTIFDDQEPSLSPKPKRKRSAFTPPTPEMVAEYAESRGVSIDGDHFCDYYASNGWMVGRNKMKDWKAAVRTWIRNAKKWNGDGGDSPDDYSAYERGWGQTRHV